MSNTKFFFYIDSKGRQLFFNTELIAYTEHHCVGDFYEIFLRNTSVNSGIAQRIKLLPSEYNELLEFIKNTNNECRY
jgi:hypothetical protein